MEQWFIPGYIQQSPVKCFILHRHTSHQNQYRLFIGHGRPHACNPAEVPVKPFNPVYSVNHWLNFRSIVQICHICLVVRIITELPYCLVVLTLPVIHILPDGRIISPRCNHAALYRKSLANQLQRRSCLHDALWLTGRTSNRLCTAEVVLLENSNRWLYQLVSSMPP